MDFLKLNIILLYIICFIPGYETKFLDIKSLNSENYFVLLDNGVFICDYNLNFKKTLIFFNQTIRDTEKVIIKKHIHKDEIYIFCLIKEYVFIYFDSLQSLFYISINQLVNSQYLDYKYYNIIPYNTKENNLNFIINSIVHVISKGYSFFYNSYLDYNVNYLEDNLNIFFKQAKSIQVYNIFMDEKNICHFLETSFVLKCTYYDNTYFSNVNYNIKKDIFSNTFLKSYIYNNIIEISSSKSDKNNYLVCPLFLKKSCLNGICNYFNNYTICMICEENQDFGYCPYISYTIEEDCFKVESFYFQDTGKFVLICKKFSEFILLTIDYQTKEAVSRKKIYKIVLIMKDIMVPFL